jgi:hypothetical protein
MFAGGRGDVTRCLILLNKIPTSISLQAMDCDFEVFCERKRHILCMLIHPECMVKIACLFNFTHESQFYETQQDQIILGYTFNLRQTNLGKTDNL